MAARKQSAGSAMDTWRRSSHTQPSITNGPTRMTVPDDAAARVVLADDLIGFCADALSAAGVPADAAAVIARNLVEADLRGVESHGVVRLPIYVKRLLAGAINPTPVIRVVRETRTTAVIDGDNGMGQWVAIEAMRRAVGKAADGDCAFVSVRGSNHFGAAAPYAMMAVDAGMIGLAFTIGGINHMTPWGGAEAILGNNPFAVALPAGRERPVVLDMACSVAARGKIIVAAKEGMPIPADWAVGPDGAPTTDAIQALAGFVQPMGGAKGYALTLVIGMLSTMLSGAGFGSEVTHMYDDLERPQNIGHLLGVLPVEAFVPAADYAARMDKAIAEVRGVRRAPGVERVFLPGEREALSMERRLKEGIPLGQGVLAELVALGDELGVPVRGLARH